MPQVRILSVRPRHSVKHAQAILRNVLGDVGDLSHVHRTMCAGVGVWICRGRKPKTVKRIIPVGRVIDHICLSGSSSIGGMLAFQAGRCEFEPRLPLHIDLGSKPDRRAGTALKAN